MNFQLILFFSLCSFSFICADLQQLEDLFYWERQLMNGDCNRLPPLSQGFDVVIIGAGLSGLTAGAALIHEGISNIKLFDENPQGFEGPWNTYATMDILRSPKELTGLALDIPHLTYQAWHVAVFGQKKWDKLDKIPREQWMDYLNWYRKVWNLPVENQCRLVAIHPSEMGFELEFVKKNRPLFVQARKVVLANGRTGCGALNLPDFIKEIPSTHYGHTYQPVNYAALKNKRVAVIGSGASSYDAVTAALDSGAKQVDVLMRRDAFPGSTAFSQFSRWLYHKAFYFMSDEWKWGVMRDFRINGTPPLKSLVKYASTFKSYTLRMNTVIQSAKMKAKVIQLKTNQGTFPYDYLILATAVSIDCRQQPVLAKVVDQIALWKDRLPSETIREDSKLGQFPYLGRYFEFQEKMPGSAPYLRNLYCFNYGAALSHGVLASEIPGVSVGASRLAEGIAIDFQIKDKN